jgi:hypothetical protein
MDLPERGESALEFLPSSSCHDALYRQKNWRM